MTQTFNENVKVVGSSDTPQLDVQGSSSQTQALQRWLGSEGNTLARLTNDGRLEIGNNLGAGAPQDALVQANQDVTLTSSSVASGQHSLGRVTIGSSLSRIVDWVFHELHLLGSAALSGVQTALRVKVVQDNTGDPANLEVRAVEGQALNQRGSSGARLRQATGVRGTVSNAGNAYATKIIGVEAGIVNDADGNITEAAAFEVAAPVNNGTIGTLYGVRIPDLTEGEANISLETGEGIVRFGDHAEVKFFTDSPTGNPPAGFLKLYLKPAGDWLRLHAKDPSGIEYELANGASSFRVDGSSDAVLHVNSSSQTNTPNIVLQKGEKSYWVLYCYPSADGSGNSGGEFAIGRLANDGSWLGATLTIARDSGYVWLHQGLVLNSGSIIQIQPNAGEGKVLTSDSGGNATWQTPAPSIPTGSVVSWTTDTAPSGWLLCSGQAVSRTTYADLYAVVGTTYGTGDGSTTFNVPDLRGRFSLGKDNMGGTSANRVTATQADNLGQSTGAENHSLALTEIPPHTHTISGYEPNAPYNKATITASATSQSVDTGSAGGGQAHNNMPPYLTLNYIIKT